MKASFFEPIRYVTSQKLPEQWPLAPGCYDPEEGGLLFQSILERLALAEELGFDWVSFSEHHYGGRILTPSPIVMASHVAAHLQKVKIVDDDDVFAQQNDDYAHAMRDVYAHYAHDYDVCALTSEALMCRTPWQLWDLENRIPADLETAIQRAEEVGDAPHAGILHFYIHCMEMSPKPERALAASDTLQPLVPDSGHLTHMPSHIYIQCGQYEKAIQANLQATAADAKYLAVDSTLGLFTTLRLHNIHFQIYGALFSGQYKVTWMKPAKSIAPIWVWTILWFDLPSISVMCGACLATPNVANA